MPILTEAPSELAYFQLSNHFPCLPGCRTSALPRQATSLLCWCEQINDSKISGTRVNLLDIVVLVAKEHKVQLLLNITCICQPIKQGAKRQSAGCGQRLKISLVLTLSNEVSEKPSTVGCLVGGA